MCRNTGFILFEAKLKRGTADVGEATLQLRESDLFLVEVRVRS